MLQIRHLTLQDTAPWDDYVQRSSSATCYHLTGWKRVVEQTFGHRMWGQTYAIDIQSTRTRILKAELVARALRIEYRDASSLRGQGGNERRESFSSREDREELLSVLESVTQRHGAVVHSIA